MRLAPARPAEDHGIGNGGAGVRQCCPKSPSRKITRHIHEAARDVARAIAKTPAYDQTRRDRKKVEMLFAHLKRILGMGRLRLRGPAGAQFEFTLAAIAQNLRRLGSPAGHCRAARCVASCCIGGVGRRCLVSPQPHAERATGKFCFQDSAPANAPIATDFCNKIRTEADLVFRAPLAGRICVSAVRR